MLFNNPNLIIMIGQQHMSFYFPILILIGLSCVPVKWAISSDIFSPSFTICSRGKLWKNTVTSERTEKWCIINKKGTDMKNKRKGHDII